MARSTYVYVVTESFSGPVAAFTVKHELIRWLRRQTSTETLHVSRLHDDPRTGDEPMELDIGELLA